MKFRIAALIVVLLAFAIRFFNLSTVGFEGDEAFGIKAAYSGFSHIIQLVATAEPHPPLFYSFLRVWYPLVGTSEFALRIPSVMANVLTIALLIKLADLFSWRYAGLFGAILLTLNPYQMWYAQDTRMYTPVAFFGIAAVYFGVLALRQGNRAFVGLYASMMALALYTHYYAIFLFVFVNLWSLAVIVLGEKAKISVRLWLLLNALIAALFLPWLIFASSISLSYARAWAGAIGMLAVLREALVRYSLGLSFPLESGYWVSLVFLLVALVGLWYAGRKQIGSTAWERRSLVAGYLFVPIGMGFLASLLRPMFEVRYFMLVSPAYYLLLGLGVVGLYKKVKPLGIVAALLLVSIDCYSLNSYFFDYQYVKTDFPDAARYIERHVRPGDAIVLDGWSQTFQFWYYNTLRMSDPTPNYLFPLSGVDGWERTPGKLDEIMSRHQGVWLLDYDVASDDPLHRVESHLARNYFQAAYHRVGWNRVVYYAAAPASLQTKALDVDCNEEIRLTDLRYGTTSVRPGEIVPLSLRIEALKSITKEYYFSWRLLDADGRTVFQRDSAPASGFASTTGLAAGDSLTDNFGLTLPTNITPGQYSVATVVYDNATGSSCQWRKDNKPLQGDLQRGESLLPTQITVLDTPAVASIEEYAPKQRADFSEAGLALLGYDFAGGSFKPGDNATLKLYWHTTADLTHDYSLAATLGAGTQKLQETEWNLAPSWAPTSKWHQGRDYVTYLDVAVPARASSGEYELSLKLVANGESKTVLAKEPKIKVVARERRFDVPALPFTASVNFNFGDLIELPAYDLHPSPAIPLSAGQEIELKPAWRALSEMPVSYKVFVHLVGPDGQIYAQKDAIPLDDKAPTNGWAKGEVLVDEYRLTLKPDAPEGNYRLIVGFYDPKSGARIPLADGTGDSVKIADLVVDKP